jgi:hypothetical protein
VRRVGAAASAAGITTEEAGAALRVLQTTLSGSWAEDTMISKSNIPLGQVSRMTIELPDGENYILENAFLEIEVEQESLDHMSMASGRMAVDRSAIINEKKTVKLKNPSPEVVEELTRLIRED